MASFSRKRIALILFCCTAIFISAFAFVEDAKPALTLVKSANMPFFNGWKEITYTYTLTNTGNVPLSGPFTVQDDRISKVRCPDVAELLPGKSLTCRGSYLTNPGQHHTLTNTATAFAQYNGKPVSSNADTASVHYIRPPKWNGPRCGDGVVTPPEQCDPPDNDNCNAQCRWIAA